MKNLGQGILDQLKNGNYNFLYTIHIFLKDGDSYFEKPLVFANEDIWDSGLHFEDAISATDVFTIGSVIVNKVDIQLMDLEKEYITHNFNKAKVVVYISPEDNINEKTKVGTYNVNEATYSDMTISLECYDNMVKFDVDFPQDKVALYRGKNISFIFNDLCQYCGVGTKQSGLELNKTYTPFQSEYFTSDAFRVDALTCRMVLGWIAEICGCYAHCDNDGDMVLDWLHENDSFVIEDTFSNDKSIEPIIITGISFSNVPKVKVEDEEGAFSWIDGEVITYRGSGYQDGYTIDVNENLFTLNETGEKVQAIVNNIASRLHGFSFYRGNFSTLPMLDINVGDVGVYREDGNDYRIIASVITYDGGADYNIVSAGQNPSRNLISRYTESAMANASIQSAINNANDRITNSVSYAKGKFGEIEADVATFKTVTTNQLTAQSAEIGTLKANKADVTDLTAANGRIDTLESTKANVSDLTATNAEITSLKANKANVSDLQATNARVGTLETGKASVTDLNAEKARIDSLETTKATVTALNAEKARIDTLETGKADIDMANVNNAWIENGVIKDASIVDSKIQGVSANKITAGTIDASKITVTNLNADNITVGTINGQRIGKESISLDKLTEEVPTKEYLDSVQENLQGQIDGAIETFTSNVVPTLNNYPANGWKDANTRKKHVGDVLYVVNASSQADGYCYRFAQNQNGSFEWVLIKDSDVTAALQRLVTAEGNISGLKTFQTETSSWITETEGELSSVKTRTSTIETTYSTKSEAQGYASTAQSNAVSSAKTYTDNATSDMATNTGVTSAINTATKDMATTSDVATAKSEAISSANGATTEKLKSYTTTSGMNTAISTAKTEAINTASSDATTKANNALNNAKGYVDDVTENMAEISDIPTKVSELTNDSSFATTTQVGTAKSEAISTASSDATTKASNALKDAKSYADTQDASTLSSANTTAKGYADTAQSTAISTASADAKTKADNALKDAKSYTDTKVSTKVESTVFNEVKQTVDSNSSKITTLTTKTDTIRSDLDGLEIGGRNYFSGNRCVAIKKPLTYNEEIRLKDYNNIGSFTQFDDGLTFDPSTTVGETYTISFDAKSPNGLTPLRLYNRNGKPQYFYFTDVILTENLQDEWEHFEYTVVNSLYPSDNPTEIEKYWRRIEIYAPSQMGVLVRNIKVEKGNKATDWTPAPEDIESQITTVSTTVNEVKQTADTNSASISSLTTTVGNNKTAIENRASAIEQDLSGFKTTVSNTYQTKDAMGDYSTTTQMNSAIKQSADSVKTTVSQTYQVKGDYSTKAEAKGYADAVQSNLDSEVKTLTERIGDAESSIEQNTNSIALKVNTSDYNTYKTTVTNAISTAKSEAISSASADATSKANTAESNAKADTTEKLKSYSTTTQVDNKISSAITASESGIALKYATQSSVNTTVQNLQQQIDGAIETFTGSAVPTLSNSPASGWTTNAIKDTHIGDLYIVNSSGGDKSGFYYRFEKSGSTYKWTLLKDSEVTKALSDAKDAMDKAKGVETDLSTNYYTKTATDSAINVSKDGILSTVSSTYQTKADGDSLASRVTTAESSIKQNADSIATKVEKNGIISAINQSAESVSINANKIDLNGYLTITNAQNTYQPKGDYATNSALSSVSTSATNAYNKAVNAESVAGDAKDTVDNLEIGGRNLIQNSTCNLGNTDIWGGEVLFDSYGFGGENALIAYRTDKVSTGRTFAVNNTRLGLMGLKIGDIITLSGYYYISSDWDFYDANLFIRWGPSGNYADSPSISIIQSKAIKDTWVYFSSTGTVLREPDARNSIFRIAFNIGESKIKFSCLKLEKGNKATDWTPAPEDVDARIDELISNVDVEYYLSTSSTSLAGGNWVTTAPAWVNGKYMWSRTKITDGAGNVTYSPSQNGTCIAGATGATGAKGDKGDKGDTGSTGSTGATGNGISKIEEQYYKSTSATSLVGGSWSTTYPGWENGKYIWTRSVITYTNGGTTTTTAVCVSGQKGDTGDSGLDGINYSQGKMMFTDPSFSSGVNYTYKYGTTSLVTWTRIAKSADNPMGDTSYEMRLGNTGNIGESAPGIGGFFFAHVSRANAVFVYRIIAKIPIGRNIQFDNSKLSGDNAVGQWYTSQNGTGKFEEYVFKLTCGSTGTFKSTGYFYVDGIYGTETNPVVVYVAYATVFDMTNTSDAQKAQSTADGIKSNIYTRNTTTIDGGKITTGSITADKINVNSLFSSEIEATNMHITGESTFDGVITAESEGPYDRLDSNGNIIDATTTVKIDPKTWKVISVVAKYVDGRYKSCEVQYDGVNITEGTYSGNTYYEENASQISLDTLSFINGNYEFSVDKNGILTNLPATFENTIYAKATSFTYGTAPSELKSRSIVFQDSAGTIGGYIQSRYNTDKTRDMSLMARDGNTYSRISAIIKADGTVSTYAPTPAKSSNTTEIATTAFVKTNLGDYLPKTGGELSNNIDIKKTTATTAHAYVGNSLHTGGLLVDASGNVGVYSSTKSKWLIYANTSGTVTANTSDIREKNLHGIMSDEEAMAILGLDVYNFAYKDDEKQIEQSGIVAQDARDALIEGGFGYRQFLQISSSDETEFYQDLGIPEEEVKYSIDYSKLVPYLMKGWQMHEEKISKLENEISDLKSGLTQIEEMLMNK